MIEILRILEMQHASIIAAILARLKAPADKTRKARGVPGSPQVPAPGAPARSALHDSIAIIYHFARRGSGCLVWERPMVEDQRDSIVADGFWQRNLRKCRNTIFSVSFWFGLTMGFPFEHFLWQRVWPFRLISQWIGL